MWENLGERMKTSEEISMDDLRKAKQAIIETSECLCNFSPIHCSKHGKIKVTKNQMALIRELWGF